ncbi:MAG: DoxX family protein [Chitinophagaceae bacterium]|nr:DoxX family protein [Chitinophagaceae bacterium]
MKKLSQYAPFFLRVIFGIYLFLALKAGVYKPELIDKYGENLTKLGIPAGNILAYVSTISMLICYTLLLIGWKARWAAFPVMINFIVAIVYGHVIPNHSLSQAVPAIVLLVLAIFILMSGPGKPSIDEGW